jgi:uncharacterized paraquat-inducible protein A
MSTVSYLSKICGLDSVSSFPADHAFARTHWDRSYFDIPYGMSPDRIEAALCTAISNTPTIFSRIVNPTPRMQRALLAIIDRSVRRREGNPAQLATMLIAAYASPYMDDAVPGLRQAIELCAHQEQRERVMSVLTFIANTKAPLEAVQSN